MRDVNKSRVGIGALAPLVNPACTGVVLNSEFSDVLDKAWSRKTKLVGEVGSRDAAHGLRVGINDQWSDDGVVLPQEVHRDIQTHML